jgi:hypothetical protein
MGTAVEMGADEIDPDCGDVYNQYDWNADGLVNMDEFNLFSKAWLSFDPYVRDPNCPDREYYSDPNSPGYVPDERFVGWDPRCNLDNTGTSQYTIDVADLTIFLEDSPWLWVACWRTDIREMQQMSMMMAGFPPEGASQSEPVLTEATSVQAEPLAVQQVQPVQQQVEPVPIQEPPIQAQEPIEAELSIEQQIADLQDAIAFLEEIWADEQVWGEIQAEDWQAVMDELYNSLTELQENDTITQETVEE